MGWGVKRLWALARNERVLAFLDQASFSFANFVVIVAFARGFSPTEFAGYGIGFAISILLASVYRVAFIVPMAIGGEERFLADRAALAGQHAWISAAVVGLAVLTCLSLHAVDVSPLVRASTIAAASTLSTFFPQDFDRAFLFRSHKPALALAWSVGYVLTTLVAAALIWNQVLGFAGIMAMFAAFGLLKTSLVMRVVAVPDFGAGRRHIARALGESASWNMLGTFASGGLAHAPLFVLGTFAPALNVAAYTAVRAPLQPIQIIVRSLDLVDKLIFGRIDVTDVSARRRHLLRTWLLYLGISAACAVVLGAAATPIIGLVAGAKYAGFEGTLRLWGLLFVLLTSSLPLETAMLASGQHKAYALIQCGAGGLAILLAVPLAHAWLDFGAVLAGLLGWCFAYCMIAWRLWNTPAFSPRPV